VFQNPLLFLHKPGTTIKMTHPLRQHIEEIIGLTDKEFDFVLSHYERIKKRKHQYIVQEEEIVNKEYWIIKGCLKSYFIEDTGKQHILQFGLENWRIKDYESSVKHTKSKTSIDCVENSEFLHISFENRDKLTAQVHKMERFWAKKSKIGRIALQNRILSLLKNSTKESYDVLLE